VYGETRTKRPRCESGQVVHTPYGPGCPYAVWHYIRRMPVSTYTPYTLPHIRRMSMQNIRRMASLNEQQVPDFRVSVQEINMQLD
jgi:hypothetical protein